MWFDASESCAPCLGNQSGGAEGASGVQNTILVQLCWVALHPRHVKYHRLPFCDAPDSKRDRLLSGYLLADPRGSGGNLLHVYAAADRGSWVESTHQEKQDGVNERMIVKEMEKEKEKESKRERERKGRVDRRL